MARRDQGTGAEVAAPTESVADDGDGSGDVSFDADLSGRSATEFPADEQQ